MTRPSALFVTNNGLTDHIGVAQVLPYIEGLAKDGHRMAVVSVENPAQWAENGAALQARMAEFGITLYPVHRWPGRWDKVQRLLALPILRRHVIRAARAFRPDIIHCRSYVPIWAALGACRAVGARMVFDMRGFWVGQRIEGGHWRKDSLFGRTLIRIFEHLESRAVRESASVVTLTYDARDVIAARDDHDAALLPVIPCSVDQTRFRVDADLRSQVRTEMGVSDDTMVIAYLGSASGVYRMDLVTKMVDLARQNGHKPHLLAIGGHTKDRLIATAQQAGVTLTKDDITCKKVPHDQVPALLNAADIGVSFYIAQPSSLGVSATKVGEYLACGLPVISNVGVGDITSVVRDGENGFVLKDEAQDLPKAGALLGSLAAMDRAAIKAGSQTYFSMDRAIESYGEVYAKSVQ